MGDKSNHMITIINKIWHLKITLFGKYNTIDKQSTQYIYTKGEYKHSMNLTKNGLIYTELISFFTIKTNTE